MAVLRVVGDELIPEDEFIALREEIKRTAMSSAEPSVDFHGALITNEAISRVDVSLTAPDGWTPTEFTAGGPLTIKILHVYTGRHPERGRRGMALLTSVDDDEGSKSNARAVNYLTKRIESHTPYSKPAYEEGTNVVVYFGGLASERIDVTFEMAFDDFPDRLVDRVSSGVSDIAKLPIVLPYAGHLFLGSQLIKLAGAVSNKFKDAAAEFKETVKLNFAPHNGPVSKADIRLVHETGAQFDNMRFDWSEGLVDKNSGAPYRGDNPYIILLIDGAVRDSLKSFSRTYASAELLRSFLDERDADEVVISGIVEAAAIWNDVNYIKRANAALAQYEAATTPETKAKFKAEYNTLLKNIQNADIAEHVKPLE